MLALTVVFSGCGKTADNPSPNDPNTSVLDPDGTVTANISTTTQIDIPSYGYIKWIGPDNFNVNSGSYGSVSICNLGAMKGLGNITNIPQTGFTTPQYSTTTVACEEGHGYVINFGGSMCVRLYMEESIINTAGGVMGAKVKYQFPFAPTYKVTFDSNGGSAVASQTAVWPNQITEPSAPSKAGYNFGGWFTDNGTFAQRIYLPIAFSVNTTLYARWLSDVAIRTAEDLYAVRNNLSLSYSLANDISLSGYANWVPIGTNSEPFTGIFKGNGHKITGLSINSSASYIGLFGYINRGSVINLGVEIDVINGDNGSYNTGGIAGVVDGGTITNCYIAGGIWATSESGGIAGNVYGGGTITNCYSNASISSTGYAGGIAGAVADGTITNCYSTGYISSYCSGGIAGSLSGGTITNCAAINPILQALYSGYAGRIAGSFSGVVTIRNNFALNTMTATGAVFDVRYINYGVDKTDGELRAQSTYSAAPAGDGGNGLGWAFGNDDANPWKMPAGGGYPILYWQQ